MINANASSRGDREPIMFTTVSEDFLIRQAHRFQQWQMQIPPSTPMDENRSMPNDQRVGHDENGLIDLWPGYGRGNVTESMENP